MTKLLRLPDNVRNIKDSFGFWDDFMWANLDEAGSEGAWISTIDTSSTTTVGDVAGGIMAMVTDGDAEDAACLERRNEAFLVAEDKPLVFGALVQFTEANTDDANVYVGVIEAPDLDTCVADSGGGPPADYDGMGFVKVFGELNWQVEDAVGTNINNTKLTAALSLDGAAKPGASALYQWLEISMDPVNADDNRINYYIDGVHVASHVNNTASATQIKPAFAVKAGGANAETLNVDAVYCYQKR